MAKKLDIDWKNLLLQKGEKIGLGVGVAVLGLMFVLGIKGVFSGSPSANAQALNEKTKTAKTLLDNNKPRDNKDSVIDPSLLTNTATLEEIKPDEYRAVASVFVPFAPADSKRREPKIEPATELVGLVAQAQIRTYMLSEDGKQVMVIRGKGVKGQDKKDLQNATNRLQSTGGRGAMGGGGANPMMGGMGGMSVGMNRGAMGNQANPMASQGGMQGGMRGGAMGGVGRRGLEDAGRAQAAGGLAGDDKGQEKDRALLDIDKLAEHTDVRLADKVLPRRMVIWEGPYPLKKQLENMMAALHSPTMADAFRELHFAGFNVQRREIGPDGKPTGDWADFQFENAIRVVVRASGKRFAEEKAEVRPLILPGLVYKLPEQFEDRKYPSAAEDMKAIQQTLTAIKEKGQTLEVAQTPEQFQVDQNDLFSDSPSSGASQGAAAPGAGNKLGGGRGAMAGDAGVQTTATARPPASATKPAAGGKGAMAEGGGVGGGTLGADWEPPEYCLIRFYDVVVDPGKTYEYRYQIKLKNPNKDRPKEVAYKELAEKEYVTSPWFEIPQRVSIPPDFHFYAVDTKELESKRYTAPKEQVVMQLQRWVDLFDPYDARKPEPVGDWAVADQVKFSRGEFIGGTHLVEMPVWNWLEEQFVMASKPDARREKRVPVRFTESDTECPVLVDFSGGTVSYLKPEERRAIEDKDVPREVLLLSPEGRLFVRNSEIDKKVPEREMHFDWWRQRVKEVKEAKDKDKKDKMDAKETGGAFGKGAGKQ